MIIMKFGGTSVGSAARMKQVAALVQAQDHPFVVLSAMSGTTNSLVEICGYLYNRNSDGAREIIGRLEEKYLKTIRELYATEESLAMAREFIHSCFEGISSAMRELFGSIQERMILAQGELLSTRMMELYLKEQGVNVLLIPALEFMRTDIHGEPDQDYISAHLKPFLSRKADIYLTQGYICRNAHSEVDNLQRGGSDYTASLIGAAAGAEEIQIWTDIDGMHNNDPRLVKGTSAVRHLHFEEAAELAYFGAKILHPTVAAKDNITAIKIKSSRMLLAHGFLRKVFEIFESYRTAIDMICTSEVGVSVSVDDTRYLSEIVHDLKKYGTVTVDLDMCIVCVVGDMDWENLGFESRVMAAMEDIPVRMVSYGGSNYNISLLVKGEDKARTLQSLSRHLFAEC